MSFSSLVLLLILKKTSLLLSVTLMLRCSTGGFWRPGEGAPLSLSDIASSRVDEASESAEW